MVLLSVTATLRAILVLVILWQLLRLIGRVQAARRERGPAVGRPDDRTRGEVRIERADRPGRTTGPIVDADFEEIR
jgi:hypothetical protein